MTRPYAAALLALAVGLQTACGVEPSADAFAAIEQSIGGRVGVAALDLNTGAGMSRRADERFPLCSTFKFLLVAMVLHRVDQGEERLDRAVPYTAADLLSHAPITKAHVGEGSMRVATLCDATLRLSDNTAANLLLDSCGGPSALTAYARTLGDPTTRLDRKEEDLNSATPGDERDTTSPAAMLATMRTLLAGHALEPPSRQRLQDWMERNTTGATLIRAGLPKEWRAGDKTGRGMNHTINDIAFLRRSDGGTILLCIFTTEAKAPTEACEAGIAKIAAVVATCFGGETLRP